MGNPAVMTALCQCSFGAAPAPLVPVLSQTTVFDQNLLAATIMDTPKTPLMTFGICSSPGYNWAAYSTAISLGLPPRTCVPLCPAPWIPGSPTVIVGGKPALNNSSKCMCTYGGVISVVNTPATTVQIP